MLVGEFEVEWVGCTVGHVGETEGSVDGSTVGELLATGLRVGYEEGILLCLDEGK